MIHGRALAGALALAASLALAACTAPADCKGDAVVCGGFCTDLASDNRSCGACGSACAAGQVCSLGACALTCAPGLIACAGSCIDPATDRAHCGASGACSGVSSGASCEDGEVCSAGTCQLSCQAGLLNCNGQCTDPSTSRSFCGASGACSGSTAGQACASGQVCAAGVCATSCPANQVACAGRCIDPLTDRAYCGASATCTGTGAGQACTAGNVCSGGTCQPSCQAGLVLCGLRCIDPQSDPTFCGVGGACSGGTACGADQACHLGTCRAIVTPPGAPTSVVASAGDASATVSWLPPSNDGGRPILGYSVTTSPSSAASTSITGTGATITGLTNGVTYSFRVLARNALGDGPLSVPSNSVTPFAPCTWSLARTETLGAMPSGGEITHAGNAAATFTTVFGRPAFYVTSDWGLLRIPTTLAGEATFAVEVDVYASSTISYPSPGVTVFTDWGPPPVWRTHGLGYLLLAPPGAPRVVGTIAYKPGDACEGWGTSDCGTSSTGILRRTAPLGPFEDAWHTLRIEGRRSACQFRVFLDGVPLDAYSGACDVSGSGMILEGHRSSAFSNYRTYQGTATCIP